MINEIDTRLNELVKLSHERSIEDFIKYHVIELPVKYDKESGLILNKTGDVIVFEIRGWGHLSKVFGESDGMVVQDYLGQEITNMINRRFMR